MARTYRFQLNIFVPLEAQHETMGWVMAHFGLTAVMNRTAHEEEEEFEVELNYEKTLYGGKTEQEYVTEVGDGLRDLLKKNVRIYAQYYCLDTIPYEELSYTGNGCDAKEREGEIEFYVTDIIYRTRTVKTSSKCPRCDQDLTESASVCAVEFHAVDTFIRADLENNSLDWDNTQTDCGGESTEYTMVVRCRSCGYTLGWATETYVEEDSCLFKGLRSDEETATLEG